MLIDQAKLLLRLWYSPSIAMGEILDRGSLLFASVAVTVASALVLSGMPASRCGFTHRFWFWLCVRPGLLLLVSTVGRRAVWWWVFPARLLADAHLRGDVVDAVLLPLALAVRTAHRLCWSCWPGCSGCYLLVLMFFAVRYGLRAGNGMPRRSPDSRGFRLPRWSPSGIRLMGVMHMLASPVFFLCDLFIWAAHSAVWATACAAARTIAACWKPRPSIPTTGRRSISSA
jgi:hypothetical protein